MRLLYLDWPHLPLRLALGRDPQPEEAVVLGGRPWDPGQVRDRSPAAGALGVRPGQPLGTAHSLAPEALFLPLEPAALAGPLEAALEGLGSLAPAVEGEVDPLAPTFGRVLIGIEGLARLWGDEPALTRRALHLVAPWLPGRPRTGIGNTRFGAAMAARAGAGAIPIGGQREEAVFLASLPLGWLPATAQTQERMRILGLRRMGELAALDRSAIIARFGTEGADLHDLVRGMDRRPLRPRRPVEHLAAEAELDPPVDALEPLRFVLHHLCGTLCEQLSARGAGAARASLELWLDPPRRGPEPAVLGYQQALPEPAAAAGLLERLLMARLEAAPPDAPVTRLRLELAGTAPEAGQQLALFERQLVQAARLEWQLTSLAVRFGEDRILRASAGDPEASLAEHRFSWQAAAVGSAITAGRAAAAGSAITAGRVVLTAEADLLARS
jgi:nucleotidyltransferase/DNA polymerase involved in DNA repair